MYKGAFTPGVFAGVRGPLAALVLFHTKFDSIKLWCVCIVLCHHKRSQCMTVKRTRVNILYFYYYFVAIMSSRVNNI